MKNPGSKFDPKAEDFIFLNYDPWAKGFRVRCKKSNQVLVRSRRDLDFNDLKFPAWKNFDVKRDLGISFDISLYKPPAMQQQQTEVAPDQKEDEKRPDTPPLILADAMPQNSDASGPSYSSTFQQDVMQNLRSGTRSGRKFLSP